MAVTAHLEREFKAVRLSLTGKVITMYGISDGKTVARYVFDDEIKAWERFMGQCELLEKGNRGA